MLEVGPGSCQRLFWELLGGLWGEWKRNKCCLLDKAEFTLGLVPPAVSGILALAEAPAQPWLAHQQPETERFPTLCLSLPCLPREGPHPMLWP